ncbi:MAG: 3-oxoacyl-ACP synthase [Proteobacteria bacterium]|nr:3-oxoacyl-ACP synthase [Pseudomonadota bacterium]
MSHTQHWFDRRTASVLGTGAALPGEPVATEEILSRLNQRFGVDVRRQGRSIATRLGVNTRYISRDLVARHEAPRPGDSNAELAARAARAAIEDAGLQTREITYLIAHTATPGTLVPPNAARVADLLDYQGPFVELRQACTGFANALVFALGLLSSPSCGPVVIVGSETGSTYFDPVRAGEDSGQLVNALQMGDGAGACVLGSPDKGRAPHLSGTFFGYAGAQLAPGFMLSGGGSNHVPLPGNSFEFQHDYSTIRARGGQLFAAGLSTVRQAGADLNEVDYFIPHQANGRMAELLSSELGLEAHRIFGNAARLGNTGSAAIWLAFHELRARLSSGARVCVLGAEATKYMFGGFLYVHV